MNRQIRKDVKLEGIPLFWHTNLSDEEIREFYEILKKEPGDPMDMPIEVSGSSSTISIRLRPLYSNKIAFKEGWCECYGFQFCFRVTYRSSAEWDMWEAREREIAELREERSNEDKVNRLLFKTEDKFLSQCAKDSFERKEFERASHFLQKRMKHAVMIEQKTRGEGFTHFNVVCQTRRECLEFYRNFPTSEQIVPFLKEYCEFSWDFFFEGEGFYFQKRQRGKVVVEETDKIFRVAIEHFPQDGKLHKDICLFWERQRQLDLAIQYCRIGCEKSLTDNTQNGFPFRLKRLLRKVRLASMMTGDSNEAE